MTTLKTRLLQPFYLASMIITIPLVWLTNPAAKEVFTQKHHWSAKRKLQVLHCVARSGARMLGFTVLVCMLLPAIAFGVLYGTLAASATGAIFGFVVMSMIPVMMPMPSSYVTGR